MPKDLEKDILDYLGENRACNIDELKRALTPLVGFCSHQEIERVLTAAKEKGLVRISLKIGQVVYYRKVKEDEKNG